MKENNESDDPWMPLDTWLAENKTEIEITHLACDKCGTAITNSDFIAVKQAWWYEVDGIICDDCNRQKTDRAQKEVVEIQEGMYCKPNSPIVVTNNAGFAHQEKVFHNDYHRHDSEYQEGLRDE